MDPVIITNMENINILFKLSRYFEYKEVNQIILTLLQQKKN